MRAVVEGRQQSNGCPIPATMFTMVVETGGPARRDAAAAAAGRWLGAVARCSGGLAARWLCASLSQPTLLSHPAAAETRPIRGAHVPSVILACLPWAAADCKLLVELYNQGWEIADHTATHKSVGRAGKSQRGCPPPPLAPA